MSDELGAKPHYEAGPYVHYYSIRAARNGAALASRSAAASRTGTVASIGLSGKPARLLRCR